MEEYMQLNKREYQKFCQSIYTPIFSLPWWMDAICGCDNWAVGLFKIGNEVCAAMPYYMEKRGEYNYITKAPLTQNNGLLIKYSNNQNGISKIHYSEKIIYNVQKFIEDLQIDVYEQQFHYSFQNFLPYFWDGYKIIPRVTYVIENTSSVDAVNDNISSKCRNTIRKGKKHVAFFDEISPERFYYEHEKIYLRQGLKCPFSFETWMRLYQACILHDAGGIITAQDSDGTILSLAFIVWDTASVYLLMGGNIPEYSNLQTYSALIYECIMTAAQKNLKFDFEGSVIKRINHSYREYGGIPKVYYRIRKVFNPDIIKMEAQKDIDDLLRLEK